MGLKPFTEMTAKDSDKVKTAACTAAGAYDVGRREWLMTVQCVTSSPGGNHC